MKLVPLLSLGIFFLVPWPVSAAGDGSIDSTTKLADETNGGPTLEASDQYGVGIASLGDLDGDGIGDIAVGAAGDDTGGSDRGAVYIHFMDTDGSIKSTTKLAHELNGGPTLADSDLYGASVASLGDLDGDGIGDIAVGARTDSTGGSDRGAVYIHFMDTDGSIKSTTKLAHELNGGPTLANSDLYGESIASLGDLDGDGIKDIAVGAVFDSTGGSLRGAVYVHFMDTDGSIKSTTKLAHELNGGPTLANSDQYGAGVASLGDLDGDGIGDIAVGARRDDTGGTNRGAVYVHFMDTDGTIQSTTKLAHETNGGPTLVDSDFYGYSVTSLGDLDGDGIGDIAVGAIGDDTGGSLRGAVYVHFMDTDGTIQSTTKLAHETNGGPTLGDFDQYGASGASLGDLDGDGIGDIAVGAIGDTNRANRGAVYIHFMAAVANGGDGGDGDGGGGCLPREITLDGPEPGEVLHAGMTKDIFWTVNGCQLDGVDLRLSFDSGSTFNEVIVLDVEPGTGHHAWTVPDMPSTHTRLKAELTLQGGTVAASDESPEDFTILGTEPGEEPAPEPEPQPEPEEGPTIDSELELQENPAPPCAHKDLLKGSAPSVYYCGIDGKRHVFPNEDVFYSWFEDFSTLKTVTDEMLTSIPLGENVTFKPGTEPEEEMLTIDSELELQENPAPPCTHEDLLKGSASNVYYCGIDGERHVFPNEDVFVSWFEDLSSLKTVSDEMLTSIPLGENVTFKPGTLVRIEAEPPVYQVEESRVLRRIPDQATSEILTLSSALVLNYRFAE